MRNKNNKYNNIGKLCREFRLSHNIQLTDVANDLRTCPSNISSFENGKNDNYNILFWYIKQGFNLKKAMKKCEVDFNDN